MKINDHLFTIKEITKITLEILRRSWKSLLIVLGGGIVLPQVLNILLYGVNPLLQREQMAQSNQFLVFVVAIFTMIVGLWTFTAALFIIRQTLQGKKPSISSVLKLAWPKLWPLLGVSVLLGAAMGVFFVFLLFITLLGGLMDSPVLQVLFGLLVGTTTLILMFFFVYLAFFPYAIILNDVKAFSSLKYSISVVRGHYWNTFGFFLLTGLLTVLATLATLLVNLLLTPLIIVVPTLGSMLAFLLSIPFTLASSIIIACALVVFYINRQAVLHPDSSPSGAAPTRTKEPTDL